MKGKSSTGKNQTTGKRGQRDAFHEDIHVLELKEASERRAQKNVIRLKELELQEKRHAAKVRKMEMDAEIQKAQLAMLSNMATMFASGSSRTGGVGGIHATNPAESGPSTLDGSTSTASWVHSQRQVSTSSSGSQMGALPSLVTPGRLHDSDFNFSTNDFRFPSSWRPDDDV
jgi:hypothetical protein